MTSSPSQATVQVVAAIIRSADGRQVLLSLRKPGQHQGDRWEFPGGKIDAGESAEAALVRELEEELGITARTFSLYDTIDHHYPDKRVRLQFWEVLGFDGNVTGREGQQVSWFALDSLSELPFPAANQPIVERLSAARLVAPSTV